MGSKAGPRPALLLPGPARPAKRSGVTAALRRQHRGGTLSCSAAWGPDVQTSAMGGVRASRRPAAPSGPPAPLVSLARVCVSCLKREVLCTSYSLKKYTLYFLLGTVSCALHVVTWQLPEWLPGPLLLCARHPGVPAPTAQAGPAGGPNGEVSDSRGWLARRLALAPLHGSEVGRPHAVTGSCPRPRWPARPESGPGHGNWRTFIFLSKAAMFGDDLRYNRQHSPRRHKDNKTAHTRRLGLEHLLLFLRRLGLQRSEAAPTGYQGEGPCTWL